jgi:hypothetical protein
MTSLLGPAPTFVGEKKLGAAGRCLAFEAGGRSVLIFWKEDEEAAADRVAAPGQPGAAWFDLMSRRLPPPVGLSTSPAYLVGPAGQAKELLAALGLAGR